MVLERVDVSAFKTQYRTANDAAKNFPNTIRVEFDDGRTYRFMRGGIRTRYGTNPHQPFVLYTREDDVNAIFKNLEVIKEGKEGFSLTNLQDASQAMQIMKFFNYRPACAVMKHLVPCGFQVSENMDGKDIYISARDCDSRSAFGSVTMFNYTVDKLTAMEVMKLFTEVIVAPAFEQDALDVFTDPNAKSNKDMRIVRYSKLEHLPRFDGEDVSGYLNFKMLCDGSLALETPYLTQMRSIDDMIIHPMVPGKDGDDYIGRVAPSDQHLHDALTAWYLNINVRSNGVVFVKDGRAISVGTGQQERIGAVEQAVYKAVQKGHEGALKESVMSSDAFFPSRDCIDHVAKYGVGAVIWPAGSINDKYTIEAANEHGVALIVPKSGERCFLHI